MADAMDFDDKRTRVKDILWKEIAQQHPLFQFTKPSQRKDQIKAVLDLYDQYLAGALSEDVIFQDHDADTIQPDVAPGDADLVWFLPYAIYMTDDRVRAQLDARADRNRQKAARKRAQEEEDAAIAAEAQKEAEDAARAAEVARQLQVQADAMQYYGQYRQAAGLETSSEAYRVSLNSLRNKLALYLSGIDQTASELSFDMSNKRKFTPKAGTLMETLWSAGDFDKSTISTAAQALAQALIDAGDTSVQEILDKAKQQRDQARLDAQERKRKAEATLLANEIAADARRTVREAAGAIRAPSEKKKKEDEEKAARLREADDFLEEEDADRAQAERDVAAEAAAEERRKRPRTGKAVDDSFVPKARTSVKQDKATGMLKIKSQRAQGIKEATRMLGELDNVKIIGSSGSQKYTMVLQASREVSWRPWRPPNDPTKAVAISSFELDDGSIMTVWRMRTCVTELAAARAGAAAAASGPAAVAQPLQIETLADGTTRAVGGALAAVGAAAGPSAAGPSAAGAADGSVLWPDGESSGIFDGLDALPGVDMGGETDALSVVDPAAALGFSAAMVPPPTAQEQAVADAVAEAEAKCAAYNDEIIERLRNDPKMPKEAVLNYSDGTQRLWLKVDYAARVLLLPNGLTDEFAHLPKIVAVHRLGGFMQLDPAPHIRPGGLAPLGPQDMDDEDGVAKLEKRKRRTAAELAADAGKPLPPSKTLPADTSPNSSVCVNGGKDPCNIFIQDLIDLQQPLLDAVPKFNCGGPANLASLAGVMDKDDIFDAKAAKAYQPTNPSDDQLKVPSYWNSGSYYNSDMLGHGISVNVDTSGNREGPNKMNRKYDVKYRGYLVKGGKRLLWTHGRYLDGHVANVVANWLLTQPKDVRTCNGAGRRFIDALMPGALTSNDQGMHAQCIDDGSGSSKLMVGRDASTLQDRKARWGRANTGVQFNDARIDNGRITGTYAESVTIRPVGGGKAKATSVNIANPYAYEAGLDRHATVAAQIMAEIRGDVAPPPPPPAVPLPAGIVGPSSLPPPPLPLPTVALLDGTTVPLSTALSEADAAEAVAARAARAAAAASDATARAAAASSGVVVHKKYSDVFLKAVDAKLERMRIKFYKTNAGAEAPATLRDDAIEAVKRQFEDDDEEDMIYTTETLAAGPGRTLAPGEEALNSDDDLDEAEWKQQEGGSRIDDFTDAV